MLYGAVVWAILIPFSAYVVDPIIPDRTGRHNLAENSSFGKLVAVGAGMGAVFGLLALMRSNIHRWRDHEESDDEDYDYDYDDFS